MNHDSHRGRHHHQAEGAAPAWPFTLMERCCNQRRIRIRIRIYSGSLYVRCTLEVVCCCSAERLAERGSEIHCLHIIVGVVRMMMMMMMMMMCSLHLLLWICIPKCGSVSEARGVFDRWPLSAMLSPGLH